MASAKSVARAELGWISNKWPDSASARAEIRYRLHESQILLLLI